MKPELRVSIQVNSFSKITNNKCKANDLNVQTWNIPEEHRISYPINIC
jgi:hypothetical protein